MTQVSTIKLLYDYNEWANSRLLAACETLTPEQWSKPAGHSWGSVHGMLVHIFAAEVIWLSRWNGVSPTTLRKPEEFPAWSDLQLAWHDHNGHLRSFVGALTDTLLKSDIHFKDTKGNEYAFPLGVLMMHLANHGTHHRGELAATLAMLDAPHPEDDLILYYRETNRSKT